MRNLNKILLAMAISGTGLLTAPLAYADKYQVNNYYGQDRYQNDDYRSHRGHDKYCRCDQHKKVVNNYYYDREPVRERVVVVEHPVYYEETRYENRYEEPHYYDDRASYPRDNRGYRSATPMVVGGIVGGVLGNQVGKGRGRDAATIAGVILGGSIGRDIGYRH